MPMMNKCRLSRKKYFIGILFCVLGVCLTSYVLLGTLSYIFGILSYVLGILSDLL